MKYVLSMLAMVVFTAPVFAQDLSAPPSGLVEIVVPDLAAACELSEPPDLTEGNEIALNALHDQSVDLEEQVAGRFNEAVKAYKAANPD